MAIWGMTAAQAKELGDKVPFDQWQERLAQFRKLRRNHFTPKEAMDAVTATAPKGGLQPLDLTNDYWQLHIQERKNWYNAQRKIAKKQGLTDIGAGIRIRRMMTDWEDKDTTIHDWFGDIYGKGMKGHKKMDEEEFAEAMQLRRERMTTEKQPYKSQRTDRQIAIQA